MLMYERITTFSGCKIKNQQRKRQAVILVSMRILHHHGKKSPPRNEKIKSEIENWKLYYDFLVHEEKLRKIFE